MLEAIGDSSGADVDRIRSNLERTKIFKIFPSGLPEPQPTAFGQTGGFNFENKVNRVWGNADAWFKEWEISNRNNQVLKIV